MRSKVTLLVCWLVAGLAAACTGASADEALITENAALGTQISEIRATATYQRDQLQVTVEYMQTAVTQVVRDNQDIAATLVAAGMDPNSVAQVQPDNQFVFTATPPAQIINNTNPGQTTAFAPAGTVDTSFEVPTPTAGQPTLYSAVMAEGVGENDCALSATTAFASTDERIYIVATAGNVTAGTVLGAQWFLAGQPVANQSFTPDFDIDQKCIWFYADQTDFVFTPGSYSVQLLLNGNAAVAPLPFTIQ